MASMADAIKSTIITEMQAALAAYYPATPAAEKIDYIGEQADDGSPPAMAGQWYCAVHAPSSREEKREPGQPYVMERWSVKITITVRSAYAPSSRISDPQALIEALLRAATVQIMNRPYDILAAINTAFGASLTNGLTIPFMIQEPMPARQNRSPQWLKAISAKQTSQVPCISGTINLVNALQIQAQGDIA